ncbi:hypothetical protein [Methylobacterium organophilum]|uniref:AAA ATPase AAA+ lid domain-containing protein n=1 Tax=Methylobacterium organophilum TaxID=410 RepID=A0ABQ4TET2_METOR|nr:hypothetical protein [Methylobacterium organophilum]GJE29788.1 hypothetical protein LKMONMHP_4674 [Methylobacterium organophilum]
MSSERTLAEEIAEAIRSQVVLLRFDEAVTLDDRFTPDEIDLLCARAANAVIDAGLAADLNRAREQDLKEKNNADR